MHTVLTGQWSVQSPEEQLALQPIPQAVPSVFRVQLVVSVWVELVPPQVPPPQV